MTKEEKTFLIQNLRGLQENMEVYKRLIRSGRLFDNRILSLKFAKDKVSMYNSLRVLKEERV